MATQLKRRIRIGLMVSLVSVMANRTHAGDKQPTSVGTESIVLSLSNSHKTLYGYSAATGTWDKIGLGSPLKEFVPALAGRLGFVVVGNRVLAYSGTVGRWDSVEVADAKEPPVPSLDSEDRIRFQVGSKIYMFSAVTGRWAIADMAVDAD